MEKSCFAADCTLLVLIGATYIMSVAGDLKSCNGSTYIFNQSDGYNWYTSKNVCELSGCALVSIESREEWNFLRQTIQNMPTEEYFIGLSKDAAGVWRWLSDNSTVNASKNNGWPWAKGQPSDDGDLEQCAQMYKDYTGQGRYNDMSCSLKMTGSKAGFICECKYGGEEKPARVTVSTITGLTDEFQTSKTARVKNLSTTATTSQSEFHSSTIQSLSLYDTEPLFSSF
ncbi:C-type lectin domain family 4 member E-like [Stylophora pistillata]|uniref:C-type lectin domain family 4 member E-like n=1 Tax=Stylophora pistillata TaxID=50429 RepID=UPI000C0549E2|nr:C-type lectin domain family 4 member E-like [Stylophora pistillata]